jgi:cytochrome subunit of sulfide dehydrogenase
MLKRNRTLQVGSRNLLARGAEPQRALSRLALGVTLVVGLSATMPSLAQSVGDNARYLASNCANCHGTNGATNVPGAFQLAGQKADYIVEQLRAFKDGKKSATIMHQIAKGYSDEQVLALANYFSKQPKVQTVTK